jgi:glutamine synthetase
MTTKTSSPELRALLDSMPDIQAMDLLQPDMNGSLRGKRIGPEDFSKAFGSGINSCGSTVIMDTKGQTFEQVVYGGQDGDPDVLSHAVPGSLAPVPWAAVPSAQVLLEMSEPDGQPFFADPRQVLRRAAQPLVEMGLHAVVATELEFYLLEHDGTRFRPIVGRIPGSELRQTGLQYASFEELSAIEPLLAELDMTCRAQNIPAGAALSEFAPGQFEVNLRHVEDPALACDHAVLFKRALKSVAQKHGLAASFMAKPFADSSGCGLHIHVSVLDDDGNNVFAAASADRAFSDTLRHAIGGLVQAMRESMPIFAPNANSYRRFRPNCYAPLAPNWGPNHRNLSLRIPLSAPADTRVEHRVAGADANPYLVVAAVLASIHHGIVNQSDPGPMVQTSEVIEERIALPIRWESALAEFEAGQILPTYLGETYHSVFAKCRREESERFHAEISDRDYEWYLRAV